MAILIFIYWRLRDVTRSTSAIQFPPPPTTPTTPIIPKRRGLVIVGTRSRLVFEQLVKLGIMSQKFGAFEESFHQNIGTSISRTLSSPYRDYLIHR